jgi:hypothetical protein
MSLVGNRFEVVFRNALISDRNAVNRRWLVRIKNLEDDALDRAASLTALAAIKSSDPNGEVSVLDARDKSVFPRTESLFELRASKFSLPKTVRETLRNRGVEQLLLLLKREDQARLALPSWDAFFGDERLDGIGYYVSSALSGKSATQFEEERNERGLYGFLVPYVFVDLILVDLRTEHVVQSSPITEGIFVGGKPPGDTKPWDLLSGAEKVRALKLILEVEITRKATEVLKTLR